MALYNKQFLQHAIKFSNSSIKNKLAGSLSFHFDYKCMANAMSQINLRKEMTQDDTMNLKINY